VFHHVQQPAGLNSQNHVLKRNTAADFKLLVFSGGSQRKVITL
jgi:hypothetical protein